MNRCLIAQPADARFIDVYLDVNSLSDLQTAVGGNIEVFPVEPGILAIFNDDGKGLELDYNGPANRHYRQVLLPGDYFAGPVLLVGDAGGDFTDLPLGFSLNYSIRGTG